jgi:diguanylate cyclase (GGDEF)-like protein
MEIDRSTVLIVEDQRINRDILKGILHLDYNVLEAENGVQALEVLKKAPNISAILLDIMMPVMDGYTLLEKLRDSPYSSIPTIAMTGEADESTEQKTLDLGAWDFVSKPYHPMTLKTRLKNVIVRSQFYLLNEMKHVYEHDSLTGLYNRTHFFEETRKLIDSNPGTTFALVRFDIDHFQNYNSFWGEEEGDKLLKYIAGRLREHAASCAPCVYARINADVYCICAPYNDIAIRAFAKDSYDELAAYNEEFRLVPSFGVYVVDDPQESIQKMYELVTLASKECKGSFLSYLSYYRPEMSLQTLRNQWVVNEMQSALDTHQFEVFLQPKYSLRSEKPYGAEALIRWRHPVRGLLSPGAFIPVFEQNGFIGKVDYYMWESVCRLLRKWLDEGRRPGPVSVNVSRVNMYNPNLAASFRGLVKKFGIPARLLNLEVTESAYMDNPKTMEKTVRELQQEGFSILMDDFGSGYSSLNTLKDIHVDVLKIDMAFLAGDSEGQRSRSILASTIRMAGWLNTPVIMEGVETRSQVEFLKSTGCNYAQGYYFARPMTVDAYEALTDGVDQAPAHNHSDNLGTLSDMLWSANPDSELIFNSMDTPAAVYQIEGEHLCVLRANDSFSQLFWGRFGSDDSLEIYRQTGISPADKNNILDAFTTTASTKQPGQCVFTLCGENGVKAEFMMTLRYWGRNTTSAVIFVQFSELAGT